MGSPFEVDVPSAIRELASMSRNARLHLSDVIRNALNPIAVICDCDLSDKEKEEFIERGVDKIVTSLKEIGC